MQSIRVSDHLGEALILARRPSTLGAGMVPIEPALAVRSVDQWFADVRGLQRRQLADLRRMLNSGATARMTKADQVGLLDWARQALAQGRLTALRRGPGASGGGGSEGPDIEPPIPLAPPPPAVVEKEKPTTWIAIALVGEDGKPVPGQQYRIKLPDGSMREGSLDGRGGARCDDIDPGTCMVGFPDLDRDAWEIKQGGGPEQLEPATGQATDHTVQSGDSTVSLAEANGLFVDTIWNLPANSELKRKRSDMNILAPGDVIVIPAKRLKQVQCPTATKHVFKRKGIPAIFRLRLVVDGDKPRAKEKYRLTIDGATVLEGTTDGDGVLQQYVSAQAKRGDLVIGPRNDEYTILFSNLEPPDSPRGIRQRLRNLGYAIEGDGEEMDDDTKAVLRGFQREHGLKDTGDADAATTRKLAELGDRIDSPLG